MAASMVLHDAATLAGHTSKVETGYWYDPKDKVGGRHAWVTINGEDFDVAHSLNVRIDNSERYSVNPGEDAELLGRLRLSLEKPPGIRLLDNKAEWEYLIPDYWNNVCREGKVGVLIWMMRDRVLSQVRNGTVLAYTRLLQDENTT